MILPDTPPPSEPTNWDARSEALRLEEWNAGIALLAASRRSLRFVLCGLAPRRSLAEVARFADLGSRLARRALSRGESEDGSSSTAHDRYLAEYEDAIKAIVAAGSPERTADVTPI